MRLWGCFASMRCLRKESDVALCVVRWFGTGEVRVFSMVWWDEVEVLIVCVNYTLILFFCYFLLFCFAIIFGKNSRFNMGRVSMKRAKKRKISVVNYLFFVFVFPIECVVLYFGLSDNPFGLFSSGEVMGDTFWRYRFIGYIWGGVVLFWWLFFLVFSSRIYK